MNISVKLFPINWDLTIYIYISYTGNLVDCILVSYILKIRDVYVIKQYVCIAPGFVNEQKFSSNKNAYIYVYRRYRDINLDKHLQFVANMFLG